MGQRPSGQSVRRVKTLLRQNSLQMDIPDRLRCLFNVTVEDRDDPYVIEVPEEEFQVGTLRPG